ncbi:hypothetical protein EFL26_03890 [Nocardioides pocheonensis]|uniref:Uncharacterized protein n=1 Tax=Nocardioides pocheonensis TaxID=661485 RepID=A0A3N0GWU6_9ACTN|nr:hypothetical protein EFL26_03890 [Nocardioides pocheonensis]
MLSAPAYAVDHVICVNNPVGVTCDQSFAFLGTAVNAADSNGMDDTIVLGPGTYSDGPYSLKEVGFHEALIGSGQGATFLTLPAGVMQIYLNVYNSTVRDLTVLMNGTTSTGDVGLDATTSMIESVTVDGSNTSSATGVFLDGSSISASTVDMARSSASFTTGINHLATGSVTDTTITASSAYYHSISGTTATLSRLKIYGAFAGITDMAGSVAVDDTLIDLGTTPEGAGLAAINDNNANGSKSIAADHVTVLGGGKFSVGAGAYARAPGALEHASITLTNSVIAGPETSLYVEATNDGAQGANSTATITTSYSDWSTSKVVQGPNGTAGIASGAGHLDVDPGFVDAAGGDYGLAASSPLIDMGAPGTGAPTQDLAGGTRVLDGNGDGAAVRDMGAYEAPAKAVQAAPVTSVTPDTTAPSTTITAHPGKRTAKRRVTFGFSSNESSVTFQCRIDKQAWGACASPKRVRVTRGWHVFRVRARDGAGNLDATPATWRFKRV